MAICRLQRCVHLVVQYLAAAFDICSVERISDCRPTMLVALRSIDTCCKLAVEALWLSRVSHGRTASGAAWLNPVQDHEFSTTEALTRAHHVINLEERTCWWAYTRLRLCVLVPDAGLIFGSPAVLWTSERRSTQSW